MAKVSPKTDVHQYTKEARGRKAAESREKSGAELLEDRQKNKERFENYVRDANNYVRDANDAMRTLETKKSILNLRKKTLEYKTGKKKKKEKKGGEVSPEDFATKWIA